MSEHEFVTTYRGVRVPSWILRMSDEDFGNAFKQGVDAVLDASTNGFAGRVFLDDSGDEWHEQSPNSFDCAWNQWDVSEGLFRQPEEELRKRYPNLALVNKPATRRPH